MAKEEIYTIPVNDAFKEDCECPFCFIYQKLERESIDFVLGPSYMEVDVRGYTNEFGFCPNHFGKLYEQNNRLGVALMLESHMKKVREDLKSQIKKQTRLPKFSLKKSKTTEEGITSYTHKLKDACFVCHRVDQAFNRYVDTFFFLWRRDDDFKTLFDGAKGFCIPHFGILFDGAAKKLNGQAYEDFIKRLISIQDKGFDRVVGDLEWFITKFDYRYEKEPWKNSKDAVIRSIEKMASFKVKP